MPACMHAPLRAGITHHRLLTSLNEFELTRLCFEMSRKLFGFAADVSFMDPANLVPTRRLAAPLPLPPLPYSGGSASTRPGRNLLVFFLRPMVSEGAEAAAAAVKDDALPSSGCDVHAMRLAERSGGPFPEPDPSAPRLPPPPLTLPRGLLPGGRRTLRSRPEPEVSPNPTEEAEGDRSPPLPTLLLLGLAGADLRN